MTLMRYLLTASWPWYVTGPLIGLMVPTLLLLGNRQLGMSAALRATCAALAPSDLEFFRYDWRRSGLWNVALAVGIAAGAWGAAHLLGIATPGIAPATVNTLARLGVPTIDGLVPARLFAWSALFTLRGAICMIGGGF